MRTILGLLAASTALALAAPAWAQDPAPAGADGANRAQASGQAEARPAMAEPPPIMVAVLASGRVPTPTVESLRSALVAQIEPMAAGRPVRPLLHAEMQAAIAACAEPACIGGIVANAGAIGAVLARLSRRGPRGPIELRIDMVDPVSGAPRVPTIVHALAEDADVGAAIAPLVETLRPAMFSPPPPPPTLLVTVNVDGALVRIDDREIGLSPVAPQQIEPGRHAVTVTRDGYMMWRREVEVDLGETERLDVTLQTLASAGIDADERPRSDGPPWYEHWGFWAGIGGGVALVAIVVGVSVAVASSAPSAPAQPTGIPLPSIQ